MNLSRPATGLLLLATLWPVRTALASHYFDVPKGPEIFPSGEGAPRNTRVVVLDSDATEVTLVDARGRAVPAGVTVLHLGHLHRPTALVLTPERRLRAHETYCVRSASHELESCFATTDEVDREAPTPGTFAELRPVSWLTLEADVGAAADDSPILLEVELLADSQACAVLLTPPPVRLDWQTVPRGSTGGGFEPDLCLSLFARGRDDVRLRVRWVDAAGQATAWQIHPVAGIRPGRSYDGVSLRWRDP